MAIRSHHREDADAIATILADGWGAAYAGFMPPDGMARVGLTRELCFHHQQVSPSSGESAEDRARERCLLSCDPDDAKQYRSGAALEEIVLGLDNGYSKNMCRRC